MMPRPRVLAPTLMAVALALAARASAQAVAGGVADVAVSPPPKTLLFQNFPNPFPTPIASVTCVWFNLQRPSAVRLDIYDLRGNLVRTLIPGAGFPALLPAGRYGRAVPDGTAGCDQRLTWDGTARDGQTVVPGVYLLRLVADGQTQILKMVFRGR